MFPGHYNNKKGAELLESKTNASPGHSYLDDRRADLQLDLLVVDHLSADLFLSPFSFQQMAPCFYFSQHQTFSQITAHRCTTPRCKVHFPLTVGVG